MKFDITSSQVKTADKKVEYSIKGESAYSLLLLLHRSAPHLTTCQCEGALLINIANAMKGSAVAALYLKG